MITTTEAVEAAVAVARELGLAVREPVLLHDSFNIRVHLSPAPVVARVQTVTSLARADPLGAMTREIAVVTYLEGIGFPVVPVSPFCLPVRTCGTASRSRSGRRPTNCPTRASPRPR